MSSQCQRSVLSCARCRKRKAKCDRQLPRCSACTGARTECVGYDPSQREGDVPRSLVQHLEDEIAKLETELKTSQVQYARSRTTSASPPAEQRGGSSAAAGDTLERAILRSTELNCMISATLPAGPGLIDLVRMNLTPSSARTTARLAGPRRCDTSPSASLNRTSTDSPVLASMPVDIVRSLVTNFVQKVLPQFPFLSVETIWQQLAAMNSTIRGSTSTLQRAPGPTGAKSSTIHLILAISVTLGCAKAGHEARCMLLSNSLFEEGITQLRAQSKDGSDMTSMQTSLLILLYATINPRSANVWILSGAVMRSCLELGLHRESAAMTEDLKETVELRRTIFWTAYCMDRSICSAIQRPLSIPDSSINTMVPRRLNQASDIGPSFGSIIAYHRLLSAMTEVHFQGSPLGAGQTWDEWLASMECKLRKWHEGSASQQAHTDLRDFALARGLSILHRPSPRVASPSQRSLLIAFEAACSAANSYREHVATGLFRRPWLSAHHTLEGAMIVLYCLRHAGACIRDKFSASRTFEMTKVFTSNFLSIASQGWTEVTTYAGVYERLLGMLLESMFTGDYSNGRFGGAQDAELASLLYPGPADQEKLRYGSRFDRRLPDPDISYSPFDFDFDFDCDFFTLHGSATDTNNSYVDQMPSYDNYGAHPGGNLLDQSWLHDHPGTSTAPIL